MTGRDMDRAFVVCLLVLGLTYALSFFPLGVFSLLAALTLSGVKTYYVVSYFMELKDQKVLIKLVGPASVVWAVTLFILTYADYLTR